MPELTTGGENPMPAISDLRANAVTPERKSYLRLDVPELVLSEDAKWIRRFRGEIAPGITGMRGADIGHATEAERLNWANGSASVTNLRALGHYIYRWSSGATTMMPAPFMGIALGGIPPADLIPSTAPSTKPGLTPGDTSSSTGVDSPPGLLSAPSVQLPPAAALETLPADQLSVGDHLVRKDVGEHPWTQTTPGSYPPIPSRGVYAGIPLDVMLTSKREFHPDAGFYFRFYIPGSAGEVRGTVIALYFGGKWCLELTGSGMGNLWELSGALNIPALRSWHIRYVVKFADVHDVCGRFHSLVIYPCLGPNQEKYLHFALLNGSSTRHTPYSLTAHITGEHYAIDENLYEVTPTSRNFDYDEDPLHVTMQGKVEVAVSRPYRVRFSISPLYFMGDPAFDNQSLLVDNPAGGYGLRTATNNWRIRISGNSIGAPVSFPLFGSSVSILPGLKVKVADWQPDGTWHIPGASFEGPITTNRATLGCRHWRTIVGGTSSTPIVTCAFFFRGGLNMAGTNLYEMSPVLWGYELHYPPTQTLVSPGEFRVPVHNASVTSGLNPNQERTLITFFDMNGYSARLRNRSFFHAVLETEVQGGTPQAPSEPRDVVPIMQGYVEIPESEQYPGIQRNALMRHSPQPTAPTFPSPEARKYDFAIGGMHLRSKIRNMRSILTFRQYGVDVTAPVDPDTGMHPPWKVTDALKDALGTLGFTPAQCIIADSPIRLYPGEGTVVEDILIEPSTDIVDWCVRVAKNYLGGYLLFVSSAPAGDPGTEGSWTLLVPPKEYGTDDPVWEFLLEPEGGLNVPAPHSASLYDVGKTFVQGNISWRIKRPAGNHLWVYTAPRQTGEGTRRYEKHFYNGLSFNVPGWSMISDPESPHYIGYEIVVAYPMPELYSLKGASHTYSNLTYAGRRIFEFACRGARVASFRAPYICRVAPPPGGAWSTPGVWTNKRFPMLGDRVRFMGSSNYFITGVTPDWNNDMAQMARYEITKMEPYPA